MHSQHHACQPSRIPCRAGTQNAGAGSGEIGCAGLSAAVYESVVLGMRADPNPGDRFGAHDSKGTVVVSYSDSDSVWVLLPDEIVPGGKRLNFGGQRMEQTPKTPRDEGLHLVGGHSRTRVALPSCSASSNKKSSLPAAESLSRCWSHSNWSRSRSHCAIRRNSSGAKFSMAASISSTRSIRRV